jgi:hypothetical protein
VVELLAERRQLVECADACGDVLCADGPVTSLADLSLTPEHRRGHGGLYDGINSGRIEVERLQVALAGLPLPRAADDRLVLAVDVSPWLRPDAATSADRLFCHVYGRGKGQAQMIPGWPYSFVAALETPAMTSPGWRSCCLICRSSCWDGCAATGYCVCRRHHGGPEPTAAHPNTVASSPWPDRRRGQRRSTLPARRPPAMARRPPAVGIGCILA